MGAQNLSATGIVLARRDTAGGFERLDVLTAAHGLLVCMRRPSRRAGQTLPDLFDEAVMELEARSGNAWFVRDYSVERRHPGIGTNYATLREAAAWSRFVLANAPHMDDLEPLHALTRQALGAWEAGRNPEAVHLKALFLFGREEGLPVKEQWLRELGEEERAEAAHILSTPTGDLDAAAAGAGVLASSLRRWFAEQHHVVDPG